MNNNLFTRARLRLTLQYTAVICAIGILLSSLFFLRTAQLIAGEYERLNRRFQMEEQGVLPPPGPMMMRRRITPEDLLSTRDQLIKQLGLINVGVVGVTFLASYWLAGKTLRPIEQAMEEQKRFVGDAAHELKTPITALRTALEVNLMNRKLDRATRAILAENLEDVTSLETLTESLLKLARVNDDQLTLAPLALVPVIAQAVKQMTPLAKKKEIRLHQVKSDPDIRVMGESRTLKDLFTIILDNAIKYSPEKTTVTVTVVRKKKMAIVSIADEGVGILPDQQERIFDRFFQVDQARTKDTHNGYGLGLSIAKKIVSQHQGNIWVESALNQGSTFSVALPLV